MHSRPLIVFVLIAAVTGRALSEAHGGGVADEDKALLFNVFSTSDSDCAGESNLYYETWGSIALSRGGNGTKSSCYAKEEANGETAYETVWCGPDPNSEDMHYWGVQRHTTADCPGEGDTVVFMAKGTCYADPASGIYVQFTGCADVPPEGAKQGQYEAVSGAAASRAGLALVAGLAWAIVAAFVA